MTKINQYDIIVATVTDIMMLLVRSRQCMPCSANFSVTLQTEILSTETSDFLKQMFFSSHLILCLFPSSLCSSSFHHISPPYCFQLSHYFPVPFTFHHYFAPIIPFLLIISPAAFYHLITSQYHIMSQSIVPFHSVHTPPQPIVQ